MANATNNALGIFHLKTLFCTRAGDTVLEGHVEAAYLVPFVGMVERDGRENPRWVPFRLSKRHLTEGDRAALDAPRYTNVEMAELGLEKGPDGNPIVDGWNKFSINDRNQLARAIHQLIKGLKIDWEKTGRVNKHFRIIKKGKKTTLVPCTTTGADIEDEVGCPFGG
jgi:hypothetical protein